MTVCLDRAHAWNAPEGAVTTDIRKRGLCAEAAFVEERGSWRGRTR